MTLRPRDRRESPTAALRDRDSFATGRDQDQGARLARDAPREVRWAIRLLRAGIVAEAADRLWRVSIDSYATTFSRLGSNLVIVTLCSAGLALVLSHYALHRRNGARIALLVMTAGGWVLWSFWLLWFSGGVDYAWWRWLGYGSIAAMQVLAVVLLFRGAGAAWFRPGTERVARPP